MAKKIIIQSYTTQTPYHQATKVMPSAPSWIIRNTGTVSMRINGGDLIVPGGSFSVDSTPILSAALLLKVKGIDFEFKNETQLDVTFEDVIGLGVFRPGFEVVETNYTFKIVEA